jgi:Lrp/AsnC family transcriptional regulator, leucine-responsive regulatory protein
LHSRVPETTILGFDVFTVVNAWVYTKQYLVQGRAKASATSPYYFLGAVPAALTLDKVDTDILRLLSIDARLSDTELARRAHSTSAVVKYRIERLEKEGIIVGYRTDLDLERLGMTFFKAQLYLRDYDLHELDRLRAFCRETPSITYFIEQIGQCKREVEMEVEDYVAYNRVLDSLTDKFSKIIRNVETTHVRSESYKWNPSVFLKAAHG